jgi:hypothetical protein
MGHNIPERDPHSELADEPGRQPAAATGNHGTVRVEEE